MIVFALCIYFFLCVQVMINGFNHNILNLLISLFEMTILGIVICWSLIKNDIKTNT